MTTDDRFWAISFHKVIKKIIPKDDLRMKTLWRPFLLQEWCPMLNVSQCLFTESRYISVISAMAWNKSFKLKCLDHAWTMPGPCLDSISWFTCTLKYFYINPQSIPLHFLLNIIRQKHWHHQEFILNINTDKCKWNMKIIN